MTTKAAAAAVHEGIRADIARLARPSVIAESIAQAWARVAELRAAGLDFEADTVEAQAREMEAGK